MITLDTLEVVLTATADGYNKTLDQAERKASGWSTRMGGMAKAAGGLVAGGLAVGASAIAAVGVAAFDISRQVDKEAGNLAATLGITKEQALAYADIARDIYGNNFADSISDAADAVGEVKRQFKDIPNEAIQGVTEDAFRLRDAFDVDVKDGISAAKTLMDNFGLSSDDAFNMIAAGYQRGLDRSGDFLDTINEYSTQFANGGADANQFFSLLDSGLQGGMLGTDKAADAFKEFRLRIQDGSTLTADSLSAIGLSAEDIAARMADGSLTAADAFAMVQAALANTEDPVARFNAGVGLMGSQFEDLGDSVAGGLTMTNDWAAGTEGALDSVDQKYKTFDQAAQALWRRMTVSISPYTDKLMELVNDAMPSVLGAFDKFDQNVGPIMTTVGNAIRTTVDFVKGLFDRFATSVDDDATGPLQYWREWADTNLPYLQQIFETVLSAVQGFWNLFGEDIMRIVDNTFNTAWTVVDTLMRNIGDVITLALQLITGDFEGAEETLNNIITRTWEAIKTIIGNHIDNIRTVITAIDWAQLGRNIIEGIAGGISAAVGKIRDAAENAARSAYEAAKSWLGINSPSKKAADGIGYPLGEGVGVGAVRAMGDVAHTIGGGLAGMMRDISVPQPSFAAASGGGRTLNITVNLAGGGYEAGRQAGKGIADELRARGLA